MVRLSIIACEILQKLYALNIYIMIYSENTKENFINVFHALCFVLEIALISREL